MNQTQAILKDLKKGKKITALDALKNYGCFRLTARIWDIETHLDTPVDRQFVTVGKKKVMQYFLKS